MLESKLFQRALGLFLLVCGGFLLYDLWSRALAGKDYAMDQAVYSPLFVVAGVLALLGRFDLAAIRAEQEARPWFWQWSLRAWIEVFIALILAVGHAFLLYWVTGTTASP